jgi:DNA-binding MarR family transcriptional regulator
MEDSASSRDARSAELVITGLLSYRLHRVANAFQRGAALLFRREFDVSLGEWRALALIGSGVANTSNRIARLAGIDPAQMSRIITKLADRGLITRGSGPGNSSPLSLTPDLGVSTYEGLIAAARARNTAFLSVLTDDEIKHLDSALEKLAATAIGMERAERARLFEADTSESRDRMDEPVDE